MCDISGQTFCPKILAMSLNITIKRTLNGRCFGDRALSGSSNDSKRIKCPAQVQTALYRSFMHESLADKVARLTEQYSTLLAKYFNQLRQESLSGNISNEQQTEDAGKSVLGKLIDLDAQLLNAVKSDAVEHQRLQLQIDQVSQEKKSVDIWLADTLQELISLDQALDSWLLHAKRKQKWLSSDARKLDPNDILKYSKKIAGITSAPPMWDPREPLGLHRPPVPQEDQMRASLLFQLRLEKPAATSDAANDNAVHDATEPVMQPQLVTNIFQQQQPTGKSRDIGLLDMDVDSDDED